MSAIHLGVDLVLSGHIHSYDRTHAVFNGSVIGPVPPANASVYVHPAAPLYVCAGTSGALPENVFVEPPPTWSAVRRNGVFGYGRLEASAAAARARGAPGAGTIARRASAAATRPS
jgi:hypothetical protein